VPAKSRNGGSKSCRSPGASAIFIVFEGGEGSGKTTAAAALATRLHAAGVEVLHTREPGGTAVGEQVRSLLHERLAPWAEAFAFLVARAQIVDEIIRPALARGTTVVCDRYEASFIAYQGYARGLDLERLWSANHAATGGLSPDLTIYLDIDPEAGLKRKLGEAEAIRTGLEDLDFHRLVRAGYLEQMEAAPPNTWARIDATLSPPQVAEAAWAAYQRKASR
jgi:dTMP kinase